ncbi:hypothetical protein EDC94DRAFT_660298 [Helicostylum pulchrum]|nr:hypothetical protein EDC94DRAFT_660298 [Helicostylum pulchrum]
MGELEEQAMLIKISKFNIAIDVEAFLQEFFSSRLSPNGKFIQLALAAVQSLWDSKLLLKAVFMNDEEFEVKRSGCYSNIAKLLEIVEQMDDDNEEK